jgi:trk system potassium uptake protein TrkH
VEPGRPLPFEIKDALLLILLFVAVVVVSWLPFVAAGYDPLDALFEVVAARGTVGLSTGITDAALPSYLKGILCADMLMGRLELIAWFMLLYPGTWFGRRIWTAVFCMAMAAGPTSCAR